MNFTAADTTVRPTRRSGLWSRTWVRNVTLVAGFTGAMIACNAIASALGNPWAALLIGPALAVLMLWAYRWAARRIENRAATDASLVGARRHLILGVAGGFTVAAATIGIIALFGGYQITGWGSIAGALTVVGIMCAVAVAEEVLFRGVILRLMQGRWGSWIALGASAVLFGLVHLINPGATVWGALAIAIEAGPMLGAAYVATGSLWLPIGLHLGWNVTTVAVFGTVGSGSEIAGSLVTSTVAGPDWLSGGAFGAEASIVSIVLCSLATVALLTVAHRRGALRGLRPASADPSDALA